MSYLRGKIDLRIALLGITGRGKSTLGNAILNKNVFETSGVGISMTEKCKTDKLQRDGREILVVDTPGFFDTEMTFAQFQERLVPFLDKSSPGPHVILFLTRADRYTEENNRAVAQFCKTFGEKILAHTIVVFTHLNSSTTETEYMNNLQIKLKEFLERCHNRYVFMPHPNNTSEMRIKVQQLIDMADQLAAENNGACYTDEMYRAQEKLIKEKLEEQAMKKRMEEEERLNAIKQDISAKYDAQLQALRNDVTLSNHERQRKQEEIDQLLVHIKETDQTIRDLQNQITMANQRIIDLSDSGNDSCVIL